MNSQESDYQIQPPKPQSRVVLAGSLEARSRDGKKWKMRRVELLGSGELLLRGKRNATRYLLDGRCTVSAVEARVSDKGLHSFSVSWPAGAYTPTPIPNRLQSKKKLGESSDSEDEGPRVREIDAELRQKKKLTKKHRAGKGMLATAATATTSSCAGTMSTQRRAMSPGSRRWATTTSATDRRRSRSRRSSASSATTISSSGCAASSASS